MVFVAAAVPNMGDDVAVAFAFAVAAALLVAVAVGLGLGDGVAYQRPSASVG